jgi:hypothetical protein
MPVSFCVQLCNGVCVNMLYSVRRKRKEKREGIICNNERMKREKRGETRKSK